MKKILIAFLLSIITTWSFGQKPEKTIETPIKPVGVIKGLSDSALVDLVQRQTFRYFWDFAHPVSGMARERSNKSFAYGDEVVTTGGPGFGVMAVIVAPERKWMSRDTPAPFLLKMVNFLGKATSYHGVFSHWMDGATGKTVPF